jgi:hypothetical protein
MILSLRCENFRCFSDTDTIELAPLTIFAGANNSGKSSILQAIYLPTMTIASEDPAICLKLVDRDYDYGSFRDLVFQHDESKFVTLSYGARFITQVVQKGKLSPKSVDGKIKISYGYYPNRKEIYVTEFALEDRKGQFMLVRPRKYKETHEVVFRGHEDKGAYLSRLISRIGLMYRPTLDPYVALNRLKQHYDEKTVQSVFNLLAHNYQFAMGFDSCFRKIRHIGPLRISPSRTYLYSGEVASAFGRRGEIALQTYAALIERGMKEDRKKIDMINKGLYRLGFIKSLNVQRLGTRHYELWTAHTESSFRANLADTGFGASQVLPVIISLFTSPDGSTLLYEQPELHLHPAAQAELGTVFTKACSPSKRILIETHSENLILRIQTEIALGNLVPESVKIYCLTARQAGHELVPIPLNKKGEFLAEWPRGFFEETYQESLKLSKARHDGKE